MYEDGSLRRDAFGLTVDDWATFLSEDPNQYSGPALLLWALVGHPDHNEEGTMSGYPFPDLLNSVANDARALAKLAASSHNDDLRIIAPAMNNLYRRIATAAEIARCLESAGKVRVAAKPAKPAESSPTPALPTPEGPARRSR